MHAAKGTGNLCSLSKQPDNGRGTDRFPSTRWSLVLEATGDDEPAAARALSELCQIYWFPIYCYIRRCGRSKEDAEDLTQNVFESLIRRESLAKVDQENGKLRAYLLASAKNVLADEHRRSTTLKRGSGKTPVSIDAALGEGYMSLLPKEEMTPESVFERAWATSLLAHVRTQLSESYQRAKKESLFAAISPFIHEESDEPPYLRLAAELGTSAGSLRVAVFRLRQKFREQLEREIADTLGDRSELDGEVNYLIGLFAT